MSRVKLIAETRVYICHKNMISISMQCRRILCGRKLVYRIATMKPPSLILCQRKIGNMALSRLKPFARARWKRLHCRLEIYGYFLQFFESFRWKYKLKNILQEVKNGLSLRQQQLQVIIYYIITCHEPFISSLADKTNAPPPQNEQYLYFSLTLKNTEVFPKLLFWHKSWVTATVFYNRFLIINLYLTTVVMHSKQRMAITP